MSSSDELVEAKGDTTAFGLSSSGWKEIRPFHALREECALDVNTLFRFRNRFQFLEEVRIRLPREGEIACHFSHGKVCFYKAAFQCGLRFLVHPFIMELLNHFNIAPSQLGMVVIEGDMIRLDEFVHLYFLKESKEYGYYELVL